MLDHEVELEVIGLCSMILNWTNGHGGLERSRDQ